MRLVSLSAALAVAAAAANHSLADAAFQGTRRLFVKREDDDSATKPTKIEELTDDGGDDCVKAINEWRKKVSTALKQDYKNIEHSQSQTDLETFVSDLTCKKLRDGEYTSLSGTESRDTEGLFVFTASTKTTAKTGGAAITCAEAIAMWESGFDKFTEEYPPVYTENSVAAKSSEDGSVYNDKNAAALVSLLSTTEQKMVCGKVSECDSDLMLCYIKPSHIKKGAYPVTPEVWHDVQVYFNTKPALSALEETHDYVKKVNEVRQVQGLGLDAFTVGGLNKSRSKRAAAKEYESFLYELTCGEVENSKINPAGEGFSIIYAVKDGKTAPTPEEAIAHWESGFDKLNDTIPPVFTAVSTLDANEKTSIYMDSSVAGYASIMADGAHTMKCYSGTGCDKSAIICVIEDATLVDNKRPISEETWAKIEKLHNIVKPTFTAIEGNCLEDINAPRTQEAIGLTAYTDGTSAQKTESEKSSLLQGTTCAKLKDSTLTVTDATSTLMYTYGSEAKCSTAVSEWKKGLAKLSDKTSLPEYKNDETLYQDASVSNFVSLMSDAQGPTAVQCYSLTGCESSGLVCELKPAVFTENQKPISDANWKKITENMSANGSTVSFSTAAVFSSALLAVLGFALQL